MPGGFRPLRPQISPTSFSADWVGALNTVNAQAPSALTGALGTRRVGIATRLCGAVPPLLCAVCLRRGPLVGLPRLQPQNKPASGFSLYCGSIGVREAGLGEYIPRPGAKPPPPANPTNRADQIRRPNSVGGFCAPRIPPRPRRGEAAPGTVPGNPGAASTRTPQARAGAIDGNRPRRGVHSDAASQGGRLCARHSSSARGRPEPCARNTWVGRRPTEERLAAVITTS